jgi:type II secretory pathway pseudopilin PulG
MRTPARNAPNACNTGEEGYLLVGLVVACFLILLFLSIAAPRVARELERDREVESEQRALQYVRAIQLYYRKNNAYPTSVEQLLGSGSSGTTIGPGAVRYLRQAYKDPLTNGEYRLILLGQAKTEVKGFFGEPLQGAPGVGIPGASLGGTPASAIGGLTPGSSVGSTSTIGGNTPGSSLSSGGGFSLGGGAFGGGTSPTVSPQAGVPGTAPSTGAAGTSGTGAAGTSGSPSSSDATTFTGSKGMFVGVGSNAKGPGLVEWNGSANIEEWEFLYDPRVELLKAKVSLLGGTPAANGTGSLGSGFAPANGINAPGGGIPGSSTPGTGFGSPTSPAPPASGSPTAAPSQ